MAAADMMIFQGDFKAMAVGISHFFSLFPNCSLSSSGVSSGAEGGICLRYNSQGAQSEGGYLEKQVFRIK